MIKKQVTLMEGGISDLFNAIINFTKTVPKGVRQTASKNPIYQNEKNKRSNQYLGGSISNYSRDLIMSFPNMCDNTLSPSTASMISRANERNIVTMLEMLFASMQFNGDNGKEILGMIHKNIKTNYSIDDAIEDIENWIDGKTEAVSPQTITTCVKVMQEQLKMGTISFPVNSLSESSLNNYLVFNILGKTVVKEVTAGNPRNGNYDQADQDEQQQKMYKSQRDDARAEREDRRKQNQENRAQAEERRKEAQERRNKAAENRAKNQENRAQAKEERDKAAEQRAQDQEQRNIERDEREKGRDQRDIEKHQDELENLRRRNVDLDIGDMQRQLLDVDVKKSNEMQPTLMIIKFNEYDSATGAYLNQSKAFIAGVKSRLISVDAMDIVERCIAKKKTQLNFLNFIRATTGEISFVKNFLLCIDQAKLDSKNEVKKGVAAKMWRVLEDRGIKNNKNKNRRAGNDASAITTLVINQETVNFMKKQYEFDIEKINNAKMIMDVYNLLGIIIADESIEVVKFLYAGNDMFEQQAYSFIERETKDSSYKKVINLLGKNNM